MNSVIRQGDVCLQKVDKLPENATKVPINATSIVLAYGKATGHIHAIYEDCDKVNLLAAGKIRYLEVMDKVTLRHEEHMAAAIMPGIYKLPVQVEYQPREISVVRD